MSGTEKQVAVQRFEGRGSEIAVFEFEGELRDLMVRTLRTELLATGTYASDARAVSPHALQSLAVGGAAAGGTALSAAFSSSLFMATADPSTLMSLGNGVGSAVMGATGITGHAAFIPVASAVPVVAPLMAIHTMTTAVTLRQFEQVDQKLNAIQDRLNEAIARTEATHVGELLNAARIVDDIYRLYEAEGAFSTDMLTRLSLAERDVGTLAERSKFLIESRQIETATKAEDVSRANYDAYAAMLASFLDLKIAYLRVCVDVQEHPRAINDSVSRLKAKIGSGMEFWDSLINRSDRLREVIAQKEKALAEMNAAKRKLPGTLGGSTSEKQVEALRQAYTSTIENEKGILKGFDSLVESAQRTLDTLDGPSTADKTPTLIYWRDEDGDHSFSTTQLRLV
ncbi:hypothetical protein NODU109028_17495 [Nocardioides dubius]|uniref:Uncharacterized protein n=1 Tax=Nocardioides dubius TaxID=317019 RepID=A0ABN1TJP3_9ACTN